jgi:hypothetical protein
LRWVWPSAYFLAALLPRIAAVFQGAVFADDLWHGPSGHLVSLRFLNVAELALWQGIFGDDYLVTAAPKIIAAIYTVALCSVLRAMLLRFEVAPICASLVPLLIPLHPIWNTFIVWNVTGVYVLSLFFVSLGYYWLINERAVPGVVAIAIGVSGYQVHAGLLPALFIFELAMRREMPWLRRALACVAGGALYGAAIAIASLAGVKAWGGRGIGDGAHNTWRGMLDNLATLTQPLLSYWLGVKTAWKLWRVPFVIFAFGTALVAKKRGVLPIAMPVLAAAVVLPLNVLPTGPRVAGAIWIAAVLSLVPLLAAAPRKVLIASVALFVVIAVPVCVTDTGNRVRAWRADREIANAIGAYWDRAGVARRDVTIVVERIGTARAEESRPIVLQNFRPVTIWEHSNAIMCPEWLFPYFGGFQFSETQRGSVWESGGRSLFGEWHHDRAARVTRLRLWSPPA